MHDIQTIGGLFTHTIMGAAIDVFDSEPDIPASLRTHDNLTITNIP